MKHILLAALLAAPVMAVAATINADNNYVTRSLSVRGTFNELEVSQIDVEYTVAPSVRIELIAPSNVAPLVEVRIEDNTLTARLRSETNVHYESGRAHARLRVSGPMLKDIEAQLGSAFKSTSIFNGDKLRRQHLGHRYHRRSGACSQGRTRIQHRLDSPYQRYQRRSI